MTGQGIGGDWITRKPETPTINIADPVKAAKEMWGGVHPMVSNAINWLKDTLTPKTQAAAGAGADITDTGPPISSISTPTTKLGTGTPTGVPAVAPVSIQNNTAVAPMQPAVEAQPPASAYGLMGRAVTNAAGAVAKGALGATQSTGPNIATAYEDAMTKEQLPVDLGRGIQNQTILQPKAMTAADYPGGVSTPAAGQPETRPVAEAPAGWTPADVVQKPAQGEGVGKGAPGTHAVLDKMMQNIIDDPRSYNYYDRGIDIKTGMHRGTENKGLNSDAMALMGHYMTAKAALAGHELTGAAHTMLAQQTLEERMRHNKMLEQDFHLRLNQQKDLASQKALETMFTKSAAYESNPMNPGEKSINMPLTYFNAWDSKSPLHPEIKSAAEEMGKRYEEYKAGTMKLSKKASLTPAEEIATKARFRKSLSLYPEVK